MREQIKWRSLLILLVLAGGIFLTLTALKRKQEVKLGAAGYTATLAFSPNSITLSAGATSEPVWINLDTGGQSVSGADIWINFDKNKLIMADITKETHATFKTYAPIDTNGNFDKAKVIGDANLTGKIVFHMLVFDWVNNRFHNPFSGVVNPVTRLKFTAKAGVTGSTSVTFSYLGSGKTNDSNVTAGQNNADPVDILAQPSLALTINFAGVSSPTPSVPPTLTPTVPISNTPTRTPTATVTQIPTPTPIRTPTPTQVPTSTVTPFPTLTPTPGPSPTTTPTRTPTPVRTVTPTPPGGLPGDANGDGRVDGVDYVIWFNHYGTNTNNGPAWGDFDRSGRVDAVDYVIWFNHYGVY